MKTSPPILFARGLLFWLGFLLSTLIWGFLCCFTVVVPLAWRFRFVRAWPLFNLWWLQVCCGLRYRVHGRANLPRTPCMIMAKHQSTWETLALYCEFPHAVYVAKKELLLIPFFGWGMWLLDYITIDRKAGRKAVQQIVEQARERFARGLWVIIFPEGTRKAVGDPPQYRLGGAVAAVSAQAPVVPVAHNAGYFWPRHGFIKYPGVIDLHILPPIDSAAQSPEQLLEAVQTAIEGKMTELRPAVLLPGQPGSEPL